MFPVSREFADPVSAMEETIGSQKIGRRSPSPSRLDDSGDEDRGEDNRGGKHGGGDDGGIAAGGCAGGGGECEWIL